MIFYFSGTGNSRWVAQKLADELNDRLVSIGDAMCDEIFRYSVSPDERIGWVFPVHSWGVPPIVMDFISKMHIDGYNSSNYCYMVCSCGDDVGNTVEMWQKALGAIEGNAAFSIQLPNNYILMPGFDVDSFSVETDKVRTAPRRLEEVALRVAERRSTIDVVRGGWAGIKTGVIYPLFKKYQMSDAKFKASPECTGCGKCACVCPVRNITLDASKHPVWNGNCTMCLGCIHCCPVKAINYGSSTRKKGRYHCKLK